MLVVTFLLGCGVCLLRFALGLGMKKKKKNGHNSITYNNWTPILAWYEVRCGSKKTPKKTCISKGLCSKYFNHSLLSSQHKWVGGGDPYDHLLRKVIFSLITKIFN